MGGIRVCLALVFGACSYSPDPSAAGSSDDAPVDTEPDGPVNANCFGRLGTICLNFLPTGAYSIGPTTNTTTTDIFASCHELTSDSNITGCVLAGTSVTIDGNLIGIGSRPLILIATEGPIIVDANVDVSSHRDPIARGAGADPLGQCEGEVTASGLGGGAGGSLVGNGGAGGSGATGTGATANTPGIPATLRGGCAGTLGGNPTTSTGGGGGGGAIWLISKQGITISGTINASGAAGEGGPNNDGLAHGGGGGGSGGMIVLDAPAIEITATGVVLAVGGGGGGSNTVGVAAGSHGSEADRAFPGTPPPGGAGALGPGGAGGTDADGMAGASNATGAASGGGGGAGHILTFGPVQSQGFVFPAIVTSR